MSTIIQGDQYILPIKIQMGGKRIIPSNCDNVKIKVGNITYSYDDGEGDLEFDTSTQTWSFPMTQEMSLTYNEKVKIQCAVKIGDTIKKTATKEINIGESIIKERWTI